MKAGLFFIFTLLSLSSYGQTESYGSFKVTDQEIIYQKIFFQDSITLDKLGDFYAKQPNVSDLDMSNGEIKFKLNDLVVDFKKFQFAQVAVPSIIQTGRYSGLVSVGAKDGKYRVTLRAIQLTGDIGYKKITTKDNLTNYACRNSGTSIAQDWCKPNTLGLLDKAFTDRFQYVEKGKSTSGDDW
jgi:hypothetical protein